MNYFVRRYALRDWLYRLHTLSAIIVAAWLFLLAVTGVIINHQEFLGLSEIEILDGYFPRYYHSDFRTGTIQANVVITDLHSGLIFGPYGRLVSDALALLIMFAVVSGVISYWLKRRLSRLPASSQVSRGKSTIE